MRVVLLGAPGAGKGTQAAQVAARFRLPHVATGDIFRANIQARTELGRAAQDYIDSGELVPDDVVIAMMLERLAEPDAGGGFVLDGFPRSMSQARALDHRLAELGTPLDAAINLEVAEEELLRRLLSRGRADDSEATVRNRLRVFATTTRPLLDYYAEAGLLFSVSAMGTVDEVVERILGAPAHVSHQPPSEAWAILAPPGVTAQPAVRP